MTAMTIESVICQHSQRGILTVKNALPEHYVSAAAEDLLLLPKGNVFIITGFYCFSAAETDGPPGAYFLAAALRKLGFSPMIISDAISAPLLRNIGFPVMIHHQTLSPEFVRNTLEIYQPVALISIERCGRAEDGRYYNMRKTDISAYTPALDTYFLEAPKEILTIGIGDGGNEIGMGNVAHQIKTLDIIPSVIAVNHLIAATVSNWGVFGLIAALSLQTSQNLLPEPEIVRNFIKGIVDKGAVDGVTGTHSYTVDGFDFEIEKQILLSLYQITRLRNL